jgi:hypothetical protein
VNTPPADHNSPLPALFIADLAGHVAEFEPFVELWTRAPPSVSIRATPVIFSIAGRAKHVAELAPDRPDLSSNLQGRTPS